MTLENLSPEDIFLLLKWFIVVVIWGMIAIGLYEDSARVKNLQDSSYITELLHILHKRNLYIYGLVSMILVIVIADDVSRTSIKPQVASVEKPQTEASEISTPQPAETAKFAVPHDSKIPFSDIAEFNETNGKQQAYIDLLKQRYETWLITYYYLKKCNKVSEQDLDIIMSSLRKELTSAHADSRVEGNITLAANGSYKEMYSEIPCDDAHIASTKTGYDNTMRRINPPAPVEKPQIAPNATSAPVTPVTQTAIPAAQ